MDILTIALARNGAGSGGGSYDDTQIRNEIDTMQEDMVRVDEDSVTEVEFAEKQDVDAVAERLNAMKGRRVLQANGNGYVQTPNIGLVCDFTVREQGNTNYAYWIIPCEAGDMVTFNGKAVTVNGSVQESAVMWVFANEDNEVVQRGSTSLKEAVEQEFTADRKGTMAISMDISLGGDSWVSKASSLSALTGMIESGEHAGGGGDIIQDPEDPNGGVVVSGTLAEIDKTLTLEDYAADAKVVGESLSKLQGDIAQQRKAICTVTESVDNLQQSAFSLYKEPVEYSTEDNVYLGDGGVVKSLNNSHIYYVSIKKGETFNITYAEYQHYSTTYNAIGFCESVPMLSSPYIGLLHATTEKTNIQISYTADKDGYICVSESVAWRKYLPVFAKQLKRLKKYINTPLKIQVFGDSISDNTWGDMKTWVNLIPQYLPMFDCTVVNNAIGGKALGHEGDNKGVWDLIVTDGTAESDADVIVILAGTNDFNGNRTMGTWGDNNKWTEYGSVQAILEKLTTTTNAHIIFCTAPQRWNSSDIARTEHNEFGQPLNTQGYSLRELVETHKSICEKYGVSVVDLYKTLGWNRYNVTRYTTDGLHPNDIGDKWICTRICAQIRKQVFND